MTPIEGHLFEQIAESFRLQIARGELQPGDRLPSIRETAHVWQCTPSTVNRAYTILANEGLVNSRRGGGTRVSGDPLSIEPAPIRSAILVNQIEGLLLNLLGQGYSEDQVETAFDTALSRWQALQIKSIARGEQDVENKLRFVGSHDLSISYLADSLSNDGNYQLEVSFQGSLGGLMALARGKANIAGSHLWDESTDEFNEPFVRRVLPGLRVALVTVVGRTFGLILPPGNPQQTSSLSDLARKEVRWVNRQPGSGTRVWLDAQLRNLNVNPDGIDGYDDVKTTHVEVAQAVKEGQATAGLGIHAAALAFDLDFIPLAQELYQLVIPEQVMETAVCRSLLAILNSDDFKQTVESYGGYKTENTGEINWIG